MSEQYLNIIDEAAHAVTLVHPDAWAGWVEQFLQYIDEYASSEMDYTDMLASVESSIRGRIDTGKW